MSFLDTVANNHKTRKTQRAEETASDPSLRQQMMQRTGELKEATLIGPNNTTIPALYCERERAFYPVFD